MSNVTREPTPFEIIMDSLGCSHCDSCDRRPSCCGDEEQPTHFEATMDALGCSDCDNCPSQPSCCGDEE